MPNGRNVEWDVPSQRGDDPPNTRRDTPPKEQPPLEGDPQRRGQIKERLIGPARKLPRQLGLWPYLLIRAYPGDAGLRPAQGVVWESPDIIVVPGVVSTVAGHTPVINPTPGVDHTVFVRAWNLGRLPALGVSVRALWANPSFDPNDPTAAEQPHYIGGAYANIADRGRPAECHPLIPLSPPWRPVVENQGHECLLAKVESIVDPGGPRFHVWTDRHVGQRNIMLAAANQDLSFIIGRLSRTLPANADLELLHGMRDVHPVLLVHQTELAGRVIAPRVLPPGATVLPDGSGHLGAVIRGADGPRFLPGHVAAPGLTRLGGGPTAIAHPDARRVDPAMTLPHAILANLGVGDLKTGTLLARLGSGPNEAHLLRFQASRNGQPIGGYTVIIQG